MAAVTPGRKYRVDSIIAHQESGIVHIVAVIDDRWVVQKKHSKQCNGWMYSLESMARFEMLLKNGCLTDAGKAKPSKITAGQVIPWP